MECCHDGDTSLDFRHFFYHIIIQKAVQSLLTIKEIINRQNNVDATCQVLRLFVYELRLVSLRTHLSDFVYIFFFHKERFPWASLILVVP